LSYQTVKPETPNSANSATATRDTRVAPERSHIPVSVQGQEKGNSLTAREAQVAIATEQGSFGWSGGSQSSYS
jgi:hypothetical protein